MRSSRFMRAECLNSKWAFDEALPISRLVAAVSESESSHPRLPPHTTSCHIVIVVTAPYRTLCHAITPCSHSSY